MGREGEREGEKHQCVMQLIYLKNVSTVELRSLKLCNMGQSQFYSRIIFPCVKQYFFGSLYYSMSILFFTLTHENISNDFVILEFCFLFCFLEVKFFLSLGKFPHSHLLIRTKLRSQRVPLQI